MNPRVTGSRFISQGLLIDETCGAALVKGLADRRIQRLQQFRECFPPRAEQGCGDFADELDHDDREAGMSIQAGPDVL